MPLPAPLCEDLHLHGLLVEPDLPLARKTFWRVGGPADGFVRVETLEQLCVVQKRASDSAVPVFVLGNGSNLLVSDRGIRGLVVQLGGALADARIVPDADPPQVDAGGGMKLSALLARAEKAGWTGFDAFAGVPGTVGGALVMNAGTSLGETESSVVHAVLVDRSGEVLTRSRAELGFAYRHSELPAGAIVAWARLATTGGDPVASKERLRAFLEKRKATQPLTLPSCGSTFRNPPGDFAGRLIEAAGLKGHRVGDAQVSEKHANFVVNLGVATAEDLRTVIEHMQSQVREHSGVNLVPEVHLAGDWSHWPTRWTP